MYATTVNHINLSIFSFLVFWKQEFSSADIVFVNTNIL